MSCGLKQLEVECNNEPRLR